MYLAAQIFSASVADGISTLVAINLLTSAKFTINLIDDSSRACMITRQI